jgi:Ser-tRNA(Ala) deacylase AlaX
MYDFDVVDGSSTVQAVRHTEDGRTEILLDRTPFYARGGGQDWDTGTVAALNAIFVVDEVRLDGFGVVHHIGSAANGQIAVGDVVTCRVDQVRRALNTRLHSGGHILDMAVDELGLPWTPGKGAHYPHMTFVEYASDFTTEQAAEVAIDIESIARRLISDDRPNAIAFMPVSRMYEVCRHVPANLPDNKPSRVVIYGETFGVPCGGTHVRSTGAIGEFAVTKVKQKQGNVKISYTVSTRA